MSSLNQLAPLTTLHIAHIGNLKSTRFSTFFNVPFGTSATFSLQMTVGLLSGREDLCGIQSSELDPVTIFMAYEPPDIESVVSKDLASGELTGLTTVEWTLSGTAEDQLSVVGFKVYTFRLIKTDFLQIEETTVSGNERSLGVTVLAGHTYHFRVKPYNNQFGGQQSPPSASVSVPCPAGHSTNDDGGCSPCPVGEFLPENQTATNCQVCPENTVSTGGAVMCQPCLNNTMANVASSACVPCQACVAGEGVAAYCKLGKETVCKMCTAGFFSRGGSSECRKCEKGYFCPDGTSSPRRCNAGSFCNVTLLPDGERLWGVAEELCEAGTYCPPGSTLPLPCVKGATCAVPASPELVLESSVLNIRESEVVNGGEITYSLSLSAKPTKPVTVTVVPSVESPSDCIGHENGLTLANDVFDFTTLNYNVPQHVVVLVQRSQTTNEGTARISFDHSISSEDQNWESAFLRPVILTLVDDSSCAVGANLFDDVVDGVRKCGCSSGTWIKSTDPKLCESALSCMACPDGLDCDFQTALPNAMVEKGKYRLTELSLDVVDCVSPEACTGAATHGGDLCAPRYTGPLCNACKRTEDGRRLVKSGLECVDCDGGMEASVHVLICGCMLLILWAVVRICSVAKANDGDGSSEGVNQRSRTVSGRAHFFYNRHFSAQNMEAFREKAQTKYKIMVAFA